MLYCLDFCLTSSHAFLYYHYVVDSIWISMLVLQGDRTKRVGVIDSEYVVHQGVKTLGGFSEEQVVF